jgi:type IV secretory pathway VirJ component
MEHLRRCKTPRLFSDDAVWGELFQVGDASANGNAQRFAVQVVGDGGWCRLRRLAHAAV